MSLSGEYSTRGSIEWIEDPDPKNNNSFRISMSDQMEYLPSIVKEKLLFVTQGRCSIYTEEGASSTLRQKDKRWDQVIY